MKKHVLTLVVTLTFALLLSPVADAADACRPPFTKPGLVGCMIVDSDGDGLFDWIEEKLGTNPRRIDTDRDGLSDGFEDMNHNGVHEPYLGETHPLRWDSDFDGLSDSVEVANHLNPLHWDTDGDGIGDAYDSCPADFNNLCVVYFVVEETVIIFEEDVFIAVPDWDGDGVEDVLDPCPFDFFDYCVEGGIIVVEEEVIVEIVDSDGDGAEDIYDPCPFDFFDTCFADEIYEEEIIIIE